MSDEMIVYEGRHILKHQFRAFVYDVNGNKKLASSWDRYQELLATGVWFSSLADIPQRDEEVIEDDEIAPELLEKAKSSKKRGK